MILWPFRKCAFSIWQNFALILANFICYLIVVNGQILNKQIYHLVALPCSYTLCIIQSSSTFHLFFYLVGPTVSCFPISSLCSSVFIVQSFQFIFRLFFLFAHFFTYVFCEPMRRTDTPKKFCHIWWIQLWKLVYKVDYEFDFDKFAPNLYVANLSTLPIMKQAFPYPYLGIGPARSIVTDGSC